MKKRVPLITLVAICLTTGNAAAADEGIDFFENRIRPVLAGQCFGCHAATAEKIGGGLLLDTAEGLRRGGDSGIAVVPDRPEASLLLRAATDLHPRLHGPPQRLAEHEILAFKRWIRDGAVWPASVEGARSGNAAMAAADHWAFRPLRRPPTPRVNRPAWRKNPVDAFVLARLESEGLEPVEAADRRTLLRRATWDLTGLPPTPEETERFLADDSPTAYSSAIDRLLASPRYGERWGRHWLDLVRYADTAGDGGDFPIPEAYKYRNYVIEAFNSDKPYDDFVREQIAGDLLPYRDDDERWAQTIATSYIAISRRIGVSPLDLRHITLEDAIDNLGKTFLGLTLGCSRCHDHKFDPVPSTDYYALYGIFDSSILPHPGEEHHPHRRDFVYRIGKEASDELLEPYRARLAEWQKKERAQLEVYRSFQRQKVTDPNLTRASTWRDLLAVRARLADVARTFPDLEIAYALQDGEPHDVHVMKAGSARERDRGELVRRGFLQALGGAKLPPKARGSGRLELAAWLTASDNPLTARVLVNRVWHHHFGKGLVKTTSDFGVRGTPPTHPELLDFLATYLIDHDWSIKELHRLLLLSGTYQLACAEEPRNAAQDPENDLLWRANRRRLDAEQIRDALLMFSGRLDLSVGGRHPFPHRLTYFYRQHDPFSETHETNRRSVYMLQKRLEKNAYLDLFDGPDGNLHVGERDASTTTLQALFFMNSEFVEKEARRTAARLLAAKDSGDLDYRIEQAYRLVFGRVPEVEETFRAAQYFASTAEELRKLSPELSRDADLLAWGGFLGSMLSSNEFLFVD